jgi:hypothetical protein
MVFKANFDRLARSLKKLRERENLPVTDEEIESIRAAASITVR